MDRHVPDLITFIGVLTGLALAYGKAFGAYQSEITQAVIDVFDVQSRYRRMLNIITGVLIAGAFTVVGAAWLDAWAIVPAGVLAGILASVEAGRKHDVERKSLQRALIDQVEPGNPLAPQGQPAD
jgi:hypothetical protein